MTNEAGRILLGPVECVSVHLKSDKEGTRSRFLLIFKCANDRGIQRSFLRGPFGLNWSPFHGYAETWQWIDKENLLDEDAHLLEYPFQGVLIPRSLPLLLALLILFGKTPGETAMLFRVPAWKTGNDPIDV